VGTSALDCEQEVKISNLIDCACWIPTIAQWHHQEWLKDREGLHGRDRSPHVIEKKLSEREQTLQRHLTDDPLPTTFVAHRANQPLGTVSLVYYQFSNEQTPTEWLTNLYVLPESRCRGIATELLHAAISHAVSLKLTRLLLYTSDQKSFYAKRHWRSINQGSVQGQQVEIMDFPLVSQEAEF